MVPVREEGYNISPDRYLLGKYIIQEQVARTKKTMAISINPTSCVLITDANNASCPLPLNITEGTDYYSACLPANDTYYAKSLALFKLYKVNTEYKLKEGLGCQ